MHGSIESRPSHLASRFSGHALRLFVTYCPRACDLGHDLRNSEFQAERRVVKVNYSRLLWLLIALVLLVYSVRGFSQGIVTGSISGTVQDPSSAVIVGASITATQEGTNAT